MSMTEEEELQREWRMDVIKKLDSLGDKVDILQAGYDLRLRHLEGNWSKAIGAIAAVNACFVIFAWWWSRGG